MVATPCFGGMVTQTYFFSIIRLLQYASSNNFTLLLTLLGHDSLITRARSSLLSAFMDNTSATHLLFIDADIGFEPEQVGRMLHFDHEFTAALYPIKTFDWQRSRNNPGPTQETHEQTALNYVGTTCKGSDAEVKDGFASAIYAGGGFQLIHRSVIQKMMNAYPETKFSTVHAFPRSTSRSPHLYALFDCMIDREEGIYLSEDYAFCQRWRAIGGKIWLDLSSRLTHIGTHEYVGNYEARTAALVAAKSASAEPLIPISAIPITPST